MVRMIPALSAAACLLAASALVPARADTAYSANDGHSAMVNGVLAAATPMKPDTLSIISFGKSAPKVVQSIEVPTSVVGPPTAIWVAPDETWAIVTSATKADPAAPGGAAANDQVSVIDLKARPPKVVQQVAAQPGATTVRVSPDGKVALVANRASGNVSVFAVDAKRLTPAGTVDFGSPNGGASGIAFLPDGKTALVSRDFDSRISVLHLDGTKVTVDPITLNAGSHPYSLDVNKAGTLAVTAGTGNMGADIDTVELIDIAAKPVRVVYAVGVPGGAEGVKFSPDGKYVAIGSQQGTPKAPSDPYYTKNGVLTMFAVEGKSLRKVATAPIGGWTQGFAFSRDGKTLLLQGMIEQAIEVFHWDGHKLTAEKPLPMGIGPAAIGTAWP